MSVDASGATATSRTLVAILLLATASCGEPLMKLPWIPLQITDGLTAFTEAVTTCNQTRTITAQLVIEGSVGGRRRPCTRWLADLSDLGSPPLARLEALARSGPSPVIFWAEGNDSTVLLPRENRVLEHGRSDVMLEALIGVPLAAPELRRLLLGCATFGPNLGREVGASWQVFVNPDPRARPGSLQLHRERGWWRVVAQTFDEGSPLAWRSEYSNFRENLPGSVRLVSSDRHRFDLRVGLSEVEANVQQGPGHFLVKIPPSALPIMLDELRRAGPLAIETATASSE